MSEEILHLAMTNYYSGVAGLSAMSATIDEIYMIRQRARRALGIDHKLDERAGIAIEKAYKEAESKNSRKLIINFPTEHKQDYLSVTDALICSSRNYLVILSESSFVMHCIGEEYDLIQAMKMSGLSHKYSRSDYLFFINDEKEKVLSFFDSI